MPAMLASLRIRNLALVEELEWNLAGGFLAVTGETGSGKSIIIGALKLLLGERADRSLIRTGAETCVVEGVFQLEDASELNERLLLQGVEASVDSELILKRVLSSSGASRQFVNCSATTLAVLRSASESLIDLHGPHEHQSLLVPDKQLGLLDAYAAAGPLRDEYQTLFRRTNQIASEQADLTGNEAALERERDLLRHQVGEISAAQLRPGEEEPLVVRYHVAQNSRRLAELSTQVLQRLSDADDAILVRAAEVQRTLRELAKIDASAAAFSEAHATAVVELGDVARSVERYAAGLELDGDQLQILEHRVNLLESLKRKYGGSLLEVITFEETAAARLRKLDSRGEEIARLDRELAISREALMKKGAELTKKRAASAPRLAQEARRHLRDLGFKKAEFEIALSAEAKPTSHGLEAAEFLFSANLGEPLKPLRAVASSGEISRLMLALKTALATQDTVPLLVFDEIDANVGGEIAHAVGAKMKSLGQAHQVLCITHLPQVAAVAATQFVVTKEFEGERTTSRLTEVKGKTRVEEVARMLGGNTESAVAHARTLLAGRK